MFRKKLAGWMAVVLTVTTVFTQTAVPVNAAEAPAGQVSVEETEQQAPESTVSEIGGVTDSEPSTLQENAMLQQEDEAPEEAVTSESPARDGAASAGSDNTEESFGIVLSDEDREAKITAAADVTQVADAEAGEDYMESEVIVLCDTEEEAQENAAAYAASTGYTVTVESFSYGVALLKMTGSPDRNKIREEIGICSIDSVENMVRLGAETDNDLPAVYPNYMRQAYSADTSREDFTDPYLKNIKADGTVQERFQWYHELVRDKFVWKKYENDNTYQDNLKKIHVAVLDSGINWEHAEFSGVMGEHRNFINREFLGYDEYGNEVYGDQTPYEEEGGDTNGHGTNVAGIIGNIANSIGGRGVAAGVMIDSYRVLGRRGAGSDYEILSGLNAAIDDKVVNGKNIRIINMSLGGARYSSAYKTVIDTARENDILIIAAAGNDNTSADHYPAAYDGVMSVAALNSDYEKSAFSNYGPTVDIAAPGGEHKADLNRPGFSREEFLWASGYQDAYDTDEYGNLYSHMAGTSQATPVVSGCAALLIAQDLGRDPEAVEEILKGTAKPLESDYEIGAGCVDIEKAMELNVEVPAPVVDTPSGQVESGAVVALSVGDFEFEDYATIKYTLNGKQPCDPSTPSEEVYTYDDTTKITISDENGNDQIELCAQTLVYGYASEPVSCTYTFDSDISQVSIHVPGGGDTAIVAEGKTIRLQAEYLPVYAVAGPVTWTIANPMIATIDKAGNLKGMHRGSTTVTAEINGAECILPIVVQAPAEQIIIQDDLTLIADGDAGVRHEIETDRIIIYPETDPRTRYTLTSSNPSIASVELGDNGKYTVVANGTGDAVLTAVTADGTNLKDTCVVHVVAQPKSIMISDKDGLSILTAKKDLTPAVVYDGEIQGTHADAGLEWFIVYGQDIAEFKNGILKLKQTVNYSREVEIYARIGTVESNHLTLTAYPVAKKIESSSNVGRVTFYLNNAFSLYNWIRVNDLNAYSRLRFSCSNKAAHIDQETGNVFFEKAGSYPITAETLDGTKLRKTVSFKAGDPKSAEGIRSKTGHIVICPGGSVTMEVIGSAPGGTKFFLLNDSGYAVMKNDYVSVSGNKITGLKTGKITQVTPGDKEQVIHWGKTYSYLGKTYGSIGFSAPIEMYPEAASQINVDYEDRENVQGTTISLEPGNEGQLKVTSILPANACQDYYTFKSANPRILTVDDTGYVRAISKGSSIVTVTAGDGSGKTEKITFKVAELADSITVTTKNGSLGVAVGKTLNMVATVLPADTVDKKVTWSLDDGTENGTLENDYAKINATSGLLTAKKPGSVTVVAKNATSGKTGDHEVEIVAATGKLELTDAGVSKNGVAVYTHSSGSLSDTAEFQVKVSSATAGEFAQPPTPTSSNTAFFTVKQSGIHKDKDTKTTTYTYEVTAKSAKACNGTVNIAATDGSNKKLSVRVKVLVPVSLIEITTPGNADTVTPGKSLKLTAKTNADASDKTVKWEFDNETDAKDLGIDVTAFKNNGTIKVDKNAATNGEVIASAIANDNSGVSQDFLVHVRKQGVTAVTIKDPADATKALRSTTLGIYPKPANANDTFAVSREFDVNVASVIRSIAADAGDYQADLDVKSSNEQIAKADYDPETGKLKVYTYDSVKGYQATKTGQATITLKAMDGSNKSATLTVKVQEPVREIYLSADKTTRDIAANGRITMKAAVNSSATGKKISWSLTDMDGHELSKNDHIATISPSGAIAPDNSKDSRLTEKTQVKAVATAADGSGTVNREVITLYPAQGAITCEWSEGTIGAQGITMEVDGSNEIVITGANGAYADYLVTYTVGAVKVYYNVKSADKTVITVTALKKGTSTIKAAARDGSGKSMSFKVMVK